METDEEYIYLMLKHCYKRLDKDIYYQYLYRYGELCAAYNNDSDRLICSFRLSQFFWGQYYTRFGDCIRAENAYLKALQMDASEKERKLLTDAKIKYELLSLYYQGNKADHLLPILEELVSLISGSSQIDELTQEEHFNILTIYNEYFHLLGDDRHIERLKNDVLCIYRDMMACACDKENILEKATNIAAGIILLVETNSISDRECLVCKEVLQALHSFSEKPNAMILRAMIRLSHKVVFSVETYVDEILKLTEEDDKSPSFKAENYQMAASFYYGAGQSDKGRRYLLRALDMITEEWHCALRYFDRRAHHTLELAQLSFLGCYDSIRKYMDEWFALEKTLQFKALASLAERERNRFFHSGMIDRKLLRDIRNMQDRIAWKEVAKIVPNQIGETECDEFELRELEAEFAEKFLFNQSFTSITLEKLQDALPNNSAIAEYLFYEVDYEKHAFSSPLRERETAIDIYVLCKKNHKCSIERWTVPNGSYVLLLARGFVDALLQMEETPRGEIDQMGKELYKKLIMPFLWWIGETTCLYIAPDRELMNVPFEILRGENNIRLEDWHNIVRIECARDLLFHSTIQTATEGSLVIGNPQFVDRDCENGNMSLPFSELEALIVGDFCNCQYYSGLNASKSLLFKASGYRTIHIATHGFFDKTEETDPMYSSLLFFAVAEDESCSGKINPDYGNGIMTADEISRLDLRGTELVVLSTCWSGMNNILEGKGFHGLLNAFSSAGVQYVISHLWAADDFSTTLLMSYFYYYYMKKSMSPPSALKAAKRNLRDTTIGQLKNNGYFEFLMDHSKDAEIREYIRCYELRDEWECPFSDEKYWGGFACYRCN